MYMFSNVKAKKAHPPRISRDLWASYQKGPQSWVNATVFYCAPT